MAADEVAALRRCPFFSAGVRPLQAMIGCPGYTPQQVRVAVNAASNSAATATSCAQIAGAAAGRGRFLPVCRHPEAGGVVAVARAQLRDGSAPTASAG
ncbi:MAG: hypothetical protein QOE72_4687 [Chloroflexota bacterium]|jgi:hypothetical protein|nr:hypothetical protein [Chloroflexota bacterium]